MIYLLSSQGGLNPGNAVLGKRRHDKDTRTVEKENKGKNEKGHERGDRTRKRRYDGQGEK
jgi:hypothetical protein